MSPVTLPGFTGVSRQPEWLAERLRLADREPDLDADPEEDPRTLALLSALVRSYLEAVQAVEGLQ
jgi:hypothetical protein